MGGGTSRPRQSQVAPEGSGEAGKRDLRLNRAWSTSDLDSPEVSAGTLSRVFRRKKSWETEREARHRTSGEKALTDVALLWERATTIGVASGKDAAAPGPSAKSLVADRLHDAVSGLLPFVDEECRSRMEAWAARPVLGAYPSSAHFSGRVIAEAIRATRQSDAVASSLQLESVSDNAGTAAILSLSSALAAVREHEPPSPQACVEVPKCLQVSSATPLSAYSLGSVDKQRLRPRPNPADHCFRSLQDEQVVRAPGEIDGADFVIDDCKDCVIQLLDCAGQVFIERCIRCKVLLGAVQGSVFVRDCADCTVRAACGQVRTRDCKHSDFLLWIPISPTVENSLGLRFGPFGAALPDVGIYTEQPAQLRRMGLATLAGDEPWLSIVDFSPEWHWRSMHVSVLTEDEADEILRTFPGVLLYAEAASLDGSRPSSANGRPDPVILGHVGKTLPEVDIEPPPLPAPDELPALPDLELVPKNRVKLEPLPLVHETPGALKSHDSPSPLRSPSSTPGRSEQLSQRSTSFSDVDVDADDISIGKRSISHSSCLSSTLASQSSTLFQAEVDPRTRKASKKGARRAAEGVPAILRLLLRVLRISMDAEMQKAADKLSQRSPAEVVAPHVRKIAGKLNNSFSKSFLTMVMEAFVEKLLEEVCLRSAASPFLRAFQPSGLITVVVSVAQGEQRTQWPEHEPCLEGAPIVSEERLDVLLRAAVAQFQKEFRAEVQLLAERLLTSLTKVGQKEVRRKGKSKVAFKVPLNVCPEEATALLSCLKGSGEATLRASRKDADEQESEAQSLLPRFLVGHAAGELQNSELSRDIFSEARGQVLQQLGQRQLTSEDVAALSDGLRAQAKEGILGGLQYECLSKVRSDLMRHADGQKYSYHLSANTFLSLDRAPDSSVCVESLLAYVVRRANLQQCYVKLCWHDRSFRGYLTEADVEEFVADFAASAVCDNVEREFLPFYVLHATRRFMFFIDERKTGRIAISKIVCSPLLSELYAVRLEGSEAHRRMSPNWFSSAKALQTYRKFCQLDTDGDGMLCAKELEQFGSGLFSPLIIERLFQEVVTDNGLLDFKGYLDLTLACENIASPLSIKFFWRLLDLQKTGVVDATALRPFVEAVLQILNNAGVAERNYELRNPHVVVDELLDMVGCQGRAVRLNDLLASPIGGSFIEVFCDGLAFWRYENRESLARHRDGDDDDEDEEEEC